MRKAQGFFRSPELLTSFPLFLSHSIKLLFPFPFFFSYFVFSYLKVFFHQKKYQALFLRQFGILKLFFFNKIDLTLHIFRNLDLKWFFLSVCFHFAENLHVSLSRLSNSFFFYRNSRFKSCENRKVFKLNFHVNVGFETCRNPYSF